MTPAAWPRAPAAVGRQAPSAGQNLRLYGARLRRRLGDAERISYLERGYALTVDPEEVDALVRGVGEQGAGGRPRR